MGQRVPRLISMTSSGRFVAIRKLRNDAPVVDLVDALGTAPRQVVPAPKMDDFVCHGDALWIAAAGRISRRRVGVVDDPTLETEIETPAELVTDGAGNVLLVRGARPAVMIESEATIEAVDVSELAPEGGLAMALSPARLIAIVGRGFEIRDRRRGVIGGGRLPERGEVTGGAVLFDGKALCFLSKDEDRALFWVVRPSGTLAHQIEIETPDHVAFAGNRGVALCAVGGSLLAVDLRYGRVANRIEAPVPALGLAIDTDARYVALAGRDPDDHHLAVLHIPYTDLFGGRLRGAAPSTTPESDARERPVAGEESETGSWPDVEMPGESEPEPASPEPHEREAAPSGPLFGGLLRALRPEVATPPRPDDAGPYPPYSSPEEHIEGLLDLIAARAGLAIAEAWDSGRLSAPDREEHLFQAEVLAILGLRRGGAEELVASLGERIAAQAERIAGQTRATLAAQRPVPLISIATQFGLDPVATRVLAAVAAPMLRGEITRLYGIVANDSARPICDTHVIETLLCTGDSLRRPQVRAALAPGGALRRHGLVQSGHAPSRNDLFASLTVDPVVLDRLLGLDLSVPPGSAVSVERAERPLEELALPPALARECVDALREPPRDGRPVRLVVAGRRGSGRTSLIAALAARAELPITLIDAERLAKNSLIEQLRAELSRAALRGTLPVVSGLEFVQTEDDQQEDRVRDVLVSHPGPLAVRSSREQRPPLNPGYLMFTIPPLGEAERLEFWQRALARRGLAAERPEALASRFRFGAGTIETVIDSVVSRLDPVLRGTDMSDQLEATARQHIDSRLGAVAQRIDRLAGWEQVALPDDILDSVREFIGRLRHRRTVYDTWGFDRKLSTARGLTALFYGPPGTGKTMVAGLIARELGLELYRVDLARITSKWIGETEKNLAEIFDAAEDGQAIILFDEADSLFAKRTEVKSSVDRYANLEVNYLLQRFDTFEGVAVLTTNFEGAIDRAFKRRLSLRLAFPFPDAEMRVRLWAAHVPPEVPNAGDFDFEYLAKRYPMSGGYIRNCVVRAAFLAASEGAALSQEHLARVIELEYRESGKLSKTSRLE